MYKYVYIKFQLPNRSEPHIINMCILIYDYVKFEFVTIK